MRFKDNMLQMQQPSIEGNPTGANTRNAFSAIRLPVARREDQAARDRAAVHPPAFGTWLHAVRQRRSACHRRNAGEAVKAKVPASLATIYNTLHQFTDVGLLRQVAVDGSKTYFDTNVSQHHHFFIESENDLVDIPHSEVAVGRTPTAPEGYEVVRVDVVVRLRRKSR